MKKEEVEKLIKQYREPTNIIFGDFVFAFSMMNECDEISVDFIATLSYNCTINMIDRILNNQSFYVPIFEITQNELDMMRIDYDNMKHIDYPDEYWFLNTDELEMDIINAL